MSSRRDYYRSPNRGYKSSNLDVAAEMTKGMAIGDDIQKDMIRRRQDEARKAAGADPKQGPKILAKQGMLDESQRMETHQTNQRDAGARFAKDLEEQAGRLADYVENLPPDDQAAAVNRIRLRFEQSGIMKFESDPNDMKGTVKELREKGAAHFGIKAPERPTVHEWRSVIRNGKKIQIPFDKYGKEMDTRLVGDAPKESDGKGSAAARRLQTEVYREVDKNYPDNKNVKFWTPEKLQEAQEVRVIADEIINEGTIKDPASIAAEAQRRWTAKAMTEANQAPRADGTGADYVMPGSASPAPTQAPKMNPQQLQEAAEWLRANPNHPRAADVRAKIEGQLR